ncbi:TRAP transporter small permease [Aliibacillus thermotolerans]|uniref:TRAP transporter small permease n=1 Tax=Aliibacillus thermotolerans TaxID=1834418 RepID=A0ABW0UBE2_9BACI|nr:TRAP transporter small permease [Aliibacillus thermotolerans]
MINKIEKYIQKIVELEQFIANLFLLFIMFIITLDVLGRNLWNKPITGTVELTELGSALLVFFALAMTHRKDEHIGIDFLVDRFPLPLRHFMIGVVEIIIAIVLFLMARHVFDNGLRMMERNATTTDLALPMYPFLFVVMFTLAIFALTAIFKAIYRFRRAVRKS